MDGVNQDRRKASSAASASSVGAEAHDEVGGSRSFSDFYRATHPQVARALALTLGDLDLAVEATDEALTRACQRWKSVAHYANPEGWVYRVGLNWARSWSRRRRRETITDRLENQPVAAAPVPDPAVAQALRRLDVKHRSVVVLRYYLDWSVADTAAALDIAPGTVKSRLHRALAQLEGQLMTSEENHGPH